MGLWDKLTNGWRTPAEPETASQDAPQAPIGPDPLPDDLRQAVMVMQGQWADMQLHWAEVLDKLTAWSNRQSARDRKAANKSLDRLAQDEAGEASPAPHLDNPISQLPSMADQKAELRRRVAALQRRTG